jgi:HlyD family secretion protein
MAARSSQGLAFLIEDRPVEAFEQLNVSARVVPLHSWYFLAAAFLTLGSFAAFSFWYQVPLKVEGRGILLAKQSVGSDSLLQVTAPASGRLSKVLVAVGASVHVGDVLAEIDQKELGDEVAATESELARLREEDARMTRFDVDEAQSQTDAQTHVEQALRRSLELDRSRLSTHQRIAAGDRTLRSRRMLSDSDALKSQADADEIESRVAAGEARLYEITYDRLRDDTARNRASLKRKLAAREAETRLELLRARFTRDTRIVSPYAGKLVELLISSHAPVEKGTAAALLRPLNAAPETLEAILFVPAGLGKKIRVGDPVEVAPDTVRRQEHGFIRGEIRSISEIPSTDQAMLAELKHPALVSSIVEKYRGQVLLSIHGALREAAKNVAADSTHSLLNRLDWSSSSGVYQPISSGTLCSASIVVERRPLIVLAMPWFRELIGID